MTIHPPDETLSALLDREPVDSVEAAHVEECATCRDRLDVLRGVVRALAEPITAPAHLREAAVRAALVENSGASGAVRRLALARRRRARAAATARRRSNILPAAAALLALVAGGWVLSQVGDSTEPTSTSTGNLLAGQADNAQTRSGNPTPSTVLVHPSSGGGSNLASGDSSGGGSAGFYNAGDIGDYGDTAPIVDRYRQYVAGSAPEQGSYMVEPPCPSPADRDVVWHAELTYKGVESYARVVVKSQSDQVLQVLNRADCALVESRAI